MRELIRKITAFIADLFFPNRCPVCREFIEWDRLLCESCNEVLKPFPENICAKCGKAECMCGSTAYDRAVVCFYYAGLAKDGILSLKDGHKEFGYYLGNLLGEKILQSNIYADGVVPVPMSENSYHKRRYNQAEVIAKKIAEINHIPLLNDLIYKNKSVVQHTLNREERLKNITAFYGTTAKLDNMKLILCDDVITTGSTLNRCAAILKEMGAAEIYAAVGTTTKLKKE